MKPRYSCHEHTETLRMVMQVILCLILILGQSLASLIPKFVHVSGRVKYYGGVYEIADAGGYYKRISVASDCYIYKHHGSWALHRTLNSSKPWTTSFNNQLIGYWSGGIKFTSFTATLPTQNKRVNLKYDQPWAGDYSRLDWLNQNGTLDWFKHNDKPVYRKLVNISYLYMNSQGVWVIGNSTLSDSGTQVVSFGDWTEWTRIENEVLIPSPYFDPIMEYFEHPDGARKCLDFDGNPVEPIDICDNNVQCRRGADELDCPFFLNLKFWVPLVFTFAFVAFGFIVWLTLECCCSSFFVRFKSEDEHIIEKLTLDKSASNVVNKVIENIIEIKTLEKEEEHNGCDVLSVLSTLQKPSAMKLLIETGFILLIDPIERHRLSQLIYEHYKRKHGGNEKEILRRLRALGSNASIQALIECRNKPGCLMRIKHKLAPIQDYLYTWSAISGIIPMMKVYSFMLDYVKDIFLLRFITYRTQYLSHEIYWMIHYTSYAHGASIALAACVIGFYLIYIDHFKISKISSKCIKVILGLVQILLSPVLPVVIILQAVKLQVRQKMIIAKWRTNRGNKENETPTEVFLKLTVLEQQNEKVARIYTDFKLIEMNIEAIPQMMCLVVYTYYSSYMGNTLIKDMQNLHLDSESFYLILSFVLSFYTSINSIFIATNFLKRGQIGMKQKSILFASYLFQIAPRVLALTGMILLPMWLTNRNSSYIYADVHVPNSVPGLLVFLHLPLHWLLHHMYYQCCITRYRSLSLPHKLLHLLSNTWVTLPMRHNLTKEEQRSKAAETAVSLIISWISTTALGLTVGFIIPDEQWMYYLLLPLFHPLAAIFLVIYYNWCHTWRGIFTWRSKIWNTLVKLKNANHHSCGLDISTMEKQVDLVRPINLLHPMIRMFLVVYNNFCHTGSGILANRSNTQSLFVQQRDEDIYKCDMTVSNTEKEIDHVRPLDEDNESCSLNISYTEEDEDLVEPLEKYNTI